MTSVTLRPPNAFIRQLPKAELHLHIASGDARIGTLVYGAAEPKSGAVVSTVRGGELPGLNHRFAVVSGVREPACRELVQAFFRERRT